MIKFGDLDAYAAPLVINATNLADVKSYLATNIATGSNVAFYFDAYSNGVNTDTTDYLRAFQGGTTAAGALSADDIFVDIFTTAGLGAVTALATNAAAKTVQIV